MAKEWVTHVRDRLMNWRTGSLLCLSPRPNLPSQTKSANQNQICHAKPTKPNQIIPNQTKLHLTSWVTHVSGRLMNWRTRSLLRLSPRQNLLGQTNQTKPNQLLRLGQTKTTKPNQICQAKPTRSDQPVCDAPQGSAYELSQPEPNQTK